MHAPPPAGLVLIGTLLASCTTPEEARRPESPVESPPTGLSEYVAPVSPIFGVVEPPGYREWSMISVARVGGDENELRVKLGNFSALQAFRNDQRPFPDGSIIARLAYAAVTVEQDNALLRGVLERSMPPEKATKLLNESLVAGAPRSVQFMVKNARKYASTGGWGFAQFTDGKPDSEAVHETCFGCHAPAKDRDFVFSRYVR